MGEITMSRRIAQSICIVLVFMIGFIAVTVLGAREGKTADLKDKGIPLSDKESWQDALPGDANDEERIVYVTESGTKYHLTTECSGLKNAKKIIGTPLATALEQEKVLCSICAKGTS